MPVTIRSLLSRGFMTARHWTAGLLAACLTLSPALADIMVSDASIKLGIGARPAAMHGVIMNHGTQDTALVSAKSPSFSRIELHMHEMNEKAMTRMVKAESFALQANGRIELKPAGKHLMLFDFQGQAGETVAVTLIFANGEQKTVTVPTSARGKHKGHMGHHGDH